MMHAIRCCPEDCRYRIEDCDWMCRDEVDHFRHCPTVDKKWKRFAIGDFGEKIHAPPSVSVEEAKFRFYRQTPAKKTTAPKNYGKALINLAYDDDE